MFCDDETGNRVSTSDSAQQAVGFTLWRRPSWTVNTNQKNFLTLISYIIDIDKQQEVDVQTFDNQPSGGPSVSSNPTRARSPRTMSQISGFKRPLMHTNSFTSDRLPVYGVETPHEATLGAMLNDINTWGIDIFKIGTLSCNRPLTSVAYQIFQVWQLLNRFSPPQN